ncbi:hypothetical protein [Amycolatopsis nigrescens]|uniref:hypothetical protein n=1 Tax=Amycolatopsis nigrescens TaxID=381445 RepID=UPI0003783E94|nr:hypothetical protein [Amycolatopsis nigrescens]
MDPNVTELEEELKRLFKGRGVQDADIKERIGPALRRACGITPEDGPERTRTLLIGRLREWVEDLPRDLAMTTSAAFGLYEHQHERHCDARLKKVGAVVDRVVKTVRRWAEKGCHMIAQKAVEQEHPDRLPSIDSPEPWHTTELRTSVVLDLPVPEVIETRRIVADRDGLETVELGLTLATPEGWTGHGSLRDLGLDVLYGGVLTERVMKSPNRVGFVLQLPYPLGRNKEHEYAFRLRLSPDRPIAPYYVATPSYPCDLFQVHVRFGRDRVPESIWRLQKTLPMEVGDSWENREEVSADPCGEVHGEFFDLVPRLSYGFAWSQVSAGGVPDARRPS